MEEERRGEERKGEEREEREENRRDAAPCAVNPVTRCAGEERCAQVLPRYPRYLLIYLIRPTEDRGPLTV